MHREIRLAREQCGIDLLGERALAVDLGQIPIHLSPVVFTATTSVRVRGWSAASSARTRATWASAMGESRETIRISSRADMPLTIARRIRASTTIPEAHLGCAGSMLTTSDGCASAIG
uniref:Uncharacterized protein n=1 Tax=Streptomyces avermitilis TaxID=33903 RepID=A0A499VQM0_STRAX|nr:hypothetical protein SAVMC3_12960 [Streptomyces avermitilis]